MGDQVTRDAETIPAEVNLLGVLASAAENWKWFLIIPIVTAFGAYILLMQRMPEYRSTAILRVEETAVLLKSPAVLRATIAELGIGDEIGSTTSDAIQELSERISISTIAPKMTQVSLVGPDQERVQSTLTSIIKNFAIQVSPRGERRKEIEQQIATISKTIEQMRGFSQILTSAKEAPVAATSESNGTALGYATLVKELLTQEDKILELQRSLRGLSNDDILQEPTAAVKTERRKRLMLPALAAIAAALGVLFVVLIGEIVKRSSGDPIAQADLKRIKNALSFSKRP